MTDLLGFHPPLVRRGIFKGVDLNVVAARLWKLDAMRAEGRIPDIRWRAYSHSKAWGVAFTTKRSIIIRLGPEAEIEDAVETVLHELVHCSMITRQHHGELFCRRLVACAREAFGLTHVTSALLSLPAEHGCIAYAIDRFLTVEMMAQNIGARLREDPDTRFEPAPPETDEQAAAKKLAASLALIEKRAAHAQKKLGDWERKLKLARTTAAKWRTKVRYYERRQEAAKRRS